ncbi:unnamed protein product [Rhizopus stolonifer]
MVINPFLPYLVEKRFWFEDEAKKYVNDITKNIKDFQRKKVLRKIDTIMEDADDKNYIVLKTSLIIWPDDISGTLFDEEEEENVVENDK